MKFFKLIYFNDEQDWNIPTIDVTFEVSKLDKFNEDNDEQCSNI